MPGSFKLQSFGLFLLLYQSWRYICFEEVERRILYQCFPENNDIVYFGMSVVKSYHSLLVL